MILITGGAGFIGSNLAAAFVDQGMPVAICDRLRSGSKWRNIGKLELRDVIVTVAAPHDDLLRRFVADLKRRGLPDSRLTAVSETKP